MTQGILFKNARLAGSIPSFRGLADVRVRDGVIAEVGTNLELSEGETAIDARGNLLSPGLVDLHVHVYPGAVLGLMADEVGYRTGVTTVIDAGSAGPLNFQEFVDRAILTQKTRVLSWINFARYGLAGSLSELDAPEKLATYDELEPFARNELVVGMKLRASSSVVGKMGIEPIRQGVAMARRLGMRVMVHVGNAPPHLPDVLSLLGAGDIVTHAFHGKPGGILTESGDVIPEAMEARERGVLFDVGHGNASFNVNVMRKCLDKGFGPDSISSDLHLQSISKVGDLPLTLSKFLALGMDPVEVLELASTRVAKNLGLNSLGAIAPGYVADLVLWRLVEGESLLFDSDGNELKSTLRLAPVMVMKGGEILLSAQEV
ncbi:MAG: amidohydrolase/deacetylase family metallohydrolase [Candidatus Fermentithermobacillus carboniphilus]|uniref:Amidohydrolase/deacetylase family metallohydrolase n=1 Tax=Candidatus Fermentithermobacillus carboniphilus TaxID=3085328 RepID=A0AAT9LDZ0_9FIRM|nr:MAG: amidohydrolase/deacetylase family metallohydrolase [Candidatus Fermentithermobacillus carboniphilus]